MTTSRADEWRARGAHFSWQPPGTNAPAVDIFHVESGPADAPTLLLVHGFPTSSVDWFDVVGLLDSRFRVCTLDFPGYGFSDKPRGWGYSLTRDADLLEHYIIDVIGTDSLVVMAHDRGDSVSLIHAVRCAQGQSAARLEHLILTNGNMYLPMSNLTGFQRMVLDPATANDVLNVITPERLAEGMGQTMFTPPRALADPDIAAMAAAFAHDDGVAVLHETIQYLVERSQNEHEWLSALAASDIPTTVIWGMHDTVSPVRVAAYIWHEYLVGKPGANRLYYVPDANHYMQNDRPGALVEALVDTLAASDDRQPGAISSEPGAPVFVDRSRDRLPSAAEVLQQPA